ncbi:MAG: CDP-2,3-bis-(O-geranylgeranyl)-sn-glycerol synthase [Candidatus Micrarchaeota archaeon]
MAVLDLLLFLIPIYIANSSPVVLGGGKSLDLGLVLSDGKRLFGDSKTIRGFVGGILAGTVAGGLIAIFYQVEFFDSQHAQFIAGFVLASGTLIGDAFGSFIKRRVGLEPGKPFFLDTMLFLIIALLLAIPFVKMELYSPLNLGLFLVLTTILHPLTNIFANRIGLKKVPW